MDGLFSRGYWIKDILKDDGHRRFIDFLDSPALPYDFSELRDGYGLRTLLVSFSEGSSTGAVINTLLIKTRCIVDDIMGNDHWQLPTTNVCDPENAGFDVGDLNQLLGLYSRLQAHLAVLQSIYSPQQNLQGRVNVPFTNIFEDSQYVRMIRELGTVLRYLNPPEFQTLPFSL
jgi:hypothetical protein